MSNWYRKTHTLSQPKQTLLLFILLHSCTTKYLLWFLAALSTRLSELNKYYLQFLKLFDTVLMLSTLAMSINFQKFYKWRSYKNMSLIKPLNLLRMVPMRYKVIMENITDQPSAINKENKYETIVIKCWKNSSRKSRSLKEEKKRKKNETSCILASTFCLEAFSWHWCREGELEGLTELKIKEMEFRKSWNL